MKDFLVNTEGGGYSATAMETSYRLPHHVTPLAYRIELSLDFAQPVFPGKVSMDLQVHQETNQVDMHAHRLQIQQAVFVHPDGSRQNAIVLTDEAAQRVRFVADGELLPVGSITLEVQYEAQFGLGMHGVYLAEDALERAICTQCQATAARQIFPCFDEPDFKATLQWTLHTSKEVIALANGVLDRVEEHPKGKTWFFAKTKSVSSYLAALTLGNFESEPAEVVHGIPMQVYAVAGKKKQTHFAARLTKKLLPFYENYFGIPYPYQKYDQVAVPGFDAGAMENIGLVLFRQNALLLNPQTASWQQEKRVAIVVAHEFAHMWFGNWVTMKWWDDLWLNEAFAEWMSHKAVHALDPSYQIWDDFQQARNHAMADDALPTTHAIWTPVKTPEEATELFDSITYEKGCAVMRMLENFLGEDAFRRGLQAYMQEFGEKNATGADLWRCLGQSSGQDVDALMQSWVAQPGFPLVAVEPASDDYRNGELVVSQHQFFSDANDQHLVGSAQWHIPMVIRYEDDAGTKEHRVLITQKTQRVALPVQGMLKRCYANAGEIGFYRQHLHPVLVKALDATSDWLTPAEQVGLITDQWALLQSGKGKIEPFLITIQGFAYSPHYQVLKALQEPIQILEQILKSFGVVKSYESFQEWLICLFQEKAAVMPIESHPNMLPEQVELQAALFSMLGHVAKSPEIIEKSKQGAALEKKDSTLVNPNMAGVFVSIAAHDGDAAYYQACLEEYLARKKAQTSPQEALRYLYVLAWFQPKELVHKTLALIEEGIVPQESIRLVLMQLLCHPHSQMEAWEYLKKSWVRLKDKVGDLGLSRLVESVGDLPSDLRADVVDFFTTHPPLRAERALARGLKRMDQTKDFSTRIRLYLAAYFYN